MMLKVSDLLTLEELPGITLVAGHKNQDQPILKVNILENPDILDWLTAGELLLTTGYIFKDDRKLQKNFLKELAKHHCAALGFKTQRYFEEVPPDLIKLADEMNVPILAIPYNYTFSQIADVLKSRVTLEQFDMNAQETALHNKIYQILETGSSSFHLQLKLQNQVVPIEIYPIKKKNVILYYLLVWNTLAPLRPVDVAHFKITAHYLLLQLQLEYSRKFEEYQQRNELFFKLIAHEKRDQAVFQQFQQYYRLAIDKPYAILLISLTLNERQRQERMSILGNQLNQVILGDKQKIVCIEIDSSFILLVEDPPEKEGDYLKMMQRLAKSSINQLMKVQEDVELFLTIGPKIQGLTQIHESYQQAIDVLAFQRQFVAEKPEMRIASYANFHFRQTLQRYFLEEGQATLRKKYLQPLQKSDQQQHTDFVHTLNVYFQSKRNLSQTAKKLFIHRNTLLQRLEKIEQLVLLDFDKEVDLLALEVALFVGT
ncbi:PucR family transcriptional regulator ligand-binding domain-containing protein [Enterococcus faecalis]|nr:PucR family transcriptional regulator ligand-binding domain-containing protein [Enterococcus faecalis]EKJ3575450.1 PucR family transcriptional regulator ligand-binding domain-containing protein [Enterococcus faecalis]